MAKKKKQEEDSVLESAEAIQAQLSKTEQFFEKNRVLVTVVLLVLIAGVGAYIAYREYTKRQAVQAEEEMFQAVYYFEQDSLNLALEGDGNALGFLDIASDYSATAQGQLAEFYIAAIYYEQGDYEGALDYAKGLSFGDLLLQARVYALRGDALMQLQDYSAAAERYMRAAEYNDDNGFRPEYLDKAALAFTEAGDTASALKAYTTIVEDHFGSRPYDNARKQKALLEAKAQ